MLDDLSERVSKMFARLNNSEDITRERVQDVIYRALTLCTQINATVCDMGPENIDHQTQAIIKEFKAGNFFLKKLFYLHVK